MFCPARQPVPDAHFGSIATPDGRTARRRNGADVIPATSFHVRRVRQVGPGSAAQTVYGAQLQARARETGNQHQVLVDTGAVEPPRARADVRGHYSAEMARHSR
jgi:hypothetical protein